MTVDNKKKGDPGDPLAWTATVISGNEIGQKMRAEYEKGMIKNKEDFEEVHKIVLCNS